VIEIDLSNKVLISKHYKLKNIDSKAEGT